MVFPVVMYGCESWTIKKAEHRRTDAFELWCWRRLLKSSLLDINRMRIQNLVKEKVYSDTFYNSKEDLIQDYYGKGIITEDRDQVQS